MKDEELDPRIRALMRAVAAASRPPRELPTDRPGDDTGASELAALGADAPHRRRSRVRVLASLAVLVLVVGLTLVWRGNADRGSVATAPAAGTDAPSTGTVDDHGPPATAPAVTAPPEPDGLPVTIIGTTGSPRGGGWSGPNLVRYDRRTHEQVVLVTSDDLRAQLPIEPRQPGETTNPMALETGPLIGSPDLSPDGTHVAFTVEWVHEGRDLAALVVVAIDGASPMRVLAPARPATTSPLGSGSQVRYSPDGQHLATAGSTIAVWSVSTGSVTSTPVALPYPVLGLQWSPDGSQLAWENHTERTDQPTTSVARFTRPSDPTSLTVTDSRVAGTQPWWSADGQLHTSASTNEMFAIDTDATHDWVIGAMFSTTTGWIGHHRLLWWPAGERGAAKYLDDLPAGFIPTSW